MKGIKLMKTILEKKIEEISAIDDTYGKIPNKWDKYISDKGKDSLDIVESMQKGFIIAD